MSDEAWPSQRFREHVINRLKSELERYKRRNPTKRVPGNARQLEGYVFQRRPGITRKEYLRTIAKVINALNCPKGFPVLQPSPFLTPPCSEPEDN